MKFSLFVICFGCLAARHHFFSVPDDKPLMYFDGAEWRTMKPNRNITSGTRQPNLSVFLDMFLNTPNVATEFDNHTDLNNTTTPQTVIARVFDGDSQQQKSIIQTTTKKIKYPDVTTNTSDKAEYSIILNHIMKDTEKIQNNTKEVSPNANLTTDPAGWIKLMIELSKTLKEIAEKQNASYYTNIQKAESFKTTSSANIPSSTTTSATIRITTPRKSNMSENRRTMEGLDEIIALLTGGIEIDNGSENSDELNKGNKKYLNKVFSPKSQIKESRAGISNNDNHYIDQYSDTDSADIISDGVEETRFVLVEDKLGNENYRVRNQ